MIKVALVTTHAPERCGLASYTQDLMRHTHDPEIEYKIVGRPFDGMSIIERIADCPVVHIHHVWALFGGLHVSHINMMRAMGKKVICTFNESTTHNKQELTEAFNQVIVHNDTTDGYTKIPHGIYDLEFPPHDWKCHTNNYIGTAGFPIPFKNDYLVSIVAERLGCKVMAFLPESTHGDAVSVRNSMMQHCPDSFITTEFLPSESIIKMLNTCVFTLFPHQHAGGGISGSVRFGLASKRPTIVSATGRTSDLVKDYQDEVYFIQNGSPSLEQTLEVAQQVVDDLKNNRAKIPNRVIKDMSWERVAQMYVSVYKELMNVPV